MYRKDNTSPPGGVPVPDRGTFGPPQGCTGPRQGVLVISIDFQINT